jgi:cobalt-zinc-cadmium efflux system protein
VGNHHHHHHHAHAEDGRRLTIALLLILGLMVGEVVAGILASSLALITDAGHMLTDAAAIALALVAANLAARPPSGAMTYGLKRAEPLSALVNGVVLLLLAAFFVFEGVRRLFDPPDVEGGLVLVVALAGIAVNIVATMVLAGTGRRSLNLEGAFQHVLTDLYAFIATAIAGFVVIVSGFDRADPIAALLVAALMIRSGIMLVGAAGRVVLEGAPEGIEPSEIGRALAAEPEVIEVHDLHVWELTTGFPALSAHVLVAPDVDCHAKRRALAIVVRERFGIEHTTLQVDHEGDRSGLLTIEPPAPG